MRFLTTGVALAVLIGSNAALAQGRGCTARGFLYQENQKRCIYNGRGDSWTYYNCLNGEWRVLSRDMQRLDPRCQNALLG